MWLILFKFYPWMLFLIVDIPMRNYHTTLRLTVTISFHVFYCLLWIRLYKQYVFKYNMTYLPYLIDTTLVHALNKLVFCYYILSFWIIKILVLILTFTKTGRKSIKYFLQMFKFYLNRIWPKPLNNKILLSKNISIKNVYLVIWSKSYILKNVLHCLYVACRYIFYSA